MPANYDPDYIRSLFNQMSSSYERVNYITSFGFSLRWRRQFLKPFAPTSTPVRVLDLMTGMGETWRAVHERFPNAEFSALDFSEGMLKQAAAKNQAHYHGRIRLLNQNVLDNELPSAHYDVVISAFGLKTFDEAQLKRLAQETQRILKPGGQFSFIEVSTPKNALLRALYKLHLKHLVPLCGKVLLGNPSEYRMLWQYTTAFSNADRVLQIFEEAGLAVKRESYFGDCASGISGTKGKFKGENPKC